MGASGEFKTPGCSKTTWRLDWLKRRRSCETELTVRLELPIELSTLLRLLLFLLLALLVVPVANNVLARLILLLLVMLELQLVGLDACGETNDVPSILKRSESILHLLLCRFCRGGT